MRKTNHYYIYPAYFEASRSRRWGRRVPKKLAINGVDVALILRAAKRLGLQCKIKETVRYPATWWSTPGVVLVKKPASGSKTRLLKELAQVLKTIKGTAPAR